MSGLSSARCEVPGAIRSVWSAQVLKVTRVRESFPLWLAISVSCLRGREGRLLWYLLEALLLQLPCLELALCVV